jgi:uncharacterized protein (TIGR04255 family)
MKNYSKAPIEEAIFDIKIDPALAIVGKDIEFIHSNISDFYPVKEFLKTFQTSFKVKEGVPQLSMTEDKGLGFRFWNEKRKQVCTFSLDGFGFSRLRPYDEWEPNFHEAMRLWKIYKDNFRPVYVKRVAVRFINVLEIPFTKFELNDYFFNPPEPPKELPQNIVEFLSRLMIKYEEHLHAITTLALQPPQKDGFTSILFDIDVFSDVRFRSDEDALLSNIFERLHGIKNDIFEKSLTPKAKELIK